MCVCACHNTPACAVVDTHLQPLSVYSLEHHRCHIYSQVSTCLGAYVHAGIWEQTDALKGKFCWMATAQLIL